MEVQEALTVLFNPSTLPMGQLFTAVLTAVLAGAFNMLAARNMANTVRRSLAERTTA
jgi:hypothetical protein